MNEAAVRQQLLKLLEGGEAHAVFDDAVKDFPVKLRGERPHGLPYSAWQLVEHVRIAQADLLEWATNQDGKYEEKKWPDDYWPQDPHPPDDRAWDHAIREIHRDCRSLQSLAQGADLTKPFPWDKKHSALRQILVACDHVSYHTGEIILLRRLLGCWKN